jgi:hypothetical protein
MRTRQSGRRTRRTKRSNDQPTRAQRLQRGRGIVAHGIEPITQAIQQAFPDFQHEVSALPSDPVIYVDVYCPNEVFQSDVPSITMTVNDHEIYVNTLASCLKAMRGTDILKRIILFGKELTSLGIQRIRLRDASEISFPNLPCSVSLAGYMILTSKNHHSWYNSHGFKSEQYDEEVKENTAFSQQPMKDLLFMIHRYRVDQMKDPLRLFMRKTLKNQNKNKGRGINKGRDNNKGKNKKEAEYDPDRLIRELMLTYGGEVAPDQTIEEGIRRIHHMAQEADSCKSPVIRFYQEAMAAALKYGIRYTTHVVYSL